MVRSTVPNPLVLIALVALSVIAGPVATATVAAQPPLGQMATTTAPDLRLEWVVPKVTETLTTPAALEPHKPAIEAPPIEGRAGESVRLKYQIRNVGATDAFAVVIRVQSGLGSVGRAMRVQPGPEAGKAIERTLDLPLAVGLAEVCVIAVLQTLRADDPRDPFTEDNRLCRRAIVRPADSDTRDTTENKGDVR